MTWTETGLDSRHSQQIDQIVISMAHLIQNHDFLAEGIGTFLPTAAYMLAKKTHAPDCTSLCPNGNSLVAGTRTLTLGYDEFDSIPNASVWLDYVQINLVLMPTILLGGTPRWTEFMRPAQVDPFGASNNVCIGTYANPVVRLPGAAGIPDASTAAKRFYYYTPRHTKQVFVEKLDFCSGAGHPANSQAGRPQQIIVLSNLCIMASGSDGRLQVTHMHPGVTREEIEENTGFVLHWDHPPKISTAPTQDELILLNQLIDPEGLRYLEALNSKTRRERLRQLLRHNAGDSQ
ncbi:MAG: ketoacid-CoA transferase [Burkholderiaceae bacterium]|nr:ketoacid-CoA transferase [Burkholderiaceae bacterium]